MRNSTQFPIKKFQLIILEKLCITYSQFDRLIPLDKHAKLLKQ
jgi:hypothetical protein